jgi:hypothetical protein
VLLWFLLTRFQDNMNAITARMSNNTQVVSTLIEQERGSYEELKKQSVELTQQTRLMQQLVDNGAKLTEIRTEELELIRQVLRQQGKALP